jgi:hypothetical protein
VQIKTRTKRQIRDRLFFDADAGAADSHSAFGSWMISSHDSSGHPARFGGRCK